MPGKAFITQQFSARGIDATLLALGFARGDDGVLSAPTDAAVSFAPVGLFYELKITLGNGTVVSAVLSKTAVKLTREEAKP